MIYVSHLLIRFLLLKDDCRFGMCWKGLSRFIRILEDAVEVPGRDDGNPQRAAETEEMGDWCWGDA